MEPLSVYSAKSYEEFLDRLNTEVFAKSPRTLVQWAKRFGYRSPRLVSMVLKGQRLPSSQMIDALAKEVGMSSGEQRYFALLIRTEKLLRLGKDPSALQLEIETLRLSAPETTSIGIDEFHSVSDWYHVVLKQLLNSPTEPKDIAEIQRRLRGKVSALDLQRALSKMEALGFLNRDSKTGKIKVIAKSIRAGGVPSQAIRRHHVQMMARAAEALNEQPIGERKFSGITFRFDRRRLKEARAALERFCEQFNAEFADDHGTDIYQLNLQFFSHTVAPLETPQ